MEVDDMVSPKDPEPSCDHCPFDVLCLGGGFCLMHPRGKLLTQGPRRTVAA